MTPKARQLRQYVRGRLEGLRDNTRGGESEFVALLHKLDDGALTWTGTLPFRYNAPKIRARV